MSTYVKKVTFKLHDSYANSTRGKIFKTISNCYNFKQMVFVLHHELTDLQNIRHKLFILT